MLGAIIQKSRKDEVEGVFPEHNAIYFTVMKMSMLGNE